MSYRSGQIALMDPFGEVPIPKKVKIAKRLAKIQGGCIGILSNQKPNVDPLLEELSEILMNEYGVGRIVRRGKLNQSLPAEESIIKDLVACDAIIHGVGD